MTTMDLVNTTTRRFLTLAILPAALAALVSTAGAPRASAENAPEQRVEDHYKHDCSHIEGSWLYTVEIPGGAGSFTFLGDETYDAGGGYSEADQLSFMTGSLATAGHGAWEQTGENQYLLTYVNLTYDDKGPTGSSKVRQKMKLNADGLKYSGSGDYFYYDLNGVVVSQGTFTITAKRITVQKPQ